MWDHCFRFRSRFLLLTQPSDPVALNCSILVCDRRAEGLSLHIESSKWTAPPHSPGCCTSSSAESSEIEHIAVGSCRRIISFNKTNVGTTSSPIHTITNCPYFRPNFRPKASACSGVKSMPAKWSSGPSLRRASSSPHRARAAPDGRTPQTKTQDHTVPAIEDARSRVEAPSVAVDANDASELSGLPGYTPRALARSSSGS